MYFHEKGIQQSVRIIWKSECILTYPKKSAHKALISTCMGCKKSSCGTLVYRSPGFMQHIQCKSITVKRNIDHRTLSGYLDICITIAGSCIYEDRFFAVLSTFNLHKCAIEFRRHNSAHGHGQLVGPCFGQYTTRGCWHFGSSMTHCWDTID